jgi:uncharacterized protein (TIGR02271 family)
VSEQRRSGGGESRPYPGRDESALDRHEDEASVAKRWQGVGCVRARREIEREPVRAVYPRQRERVAQERVPVDENDSGRIETLPDGSISIPLFEEELVVTKRTVLRERIVIRRETVTDWETVEAELRRETISIDAEEVPPDSVEAVDDDYLFGGSELCGVSVYDPYGHKIGNVDEVVCGKRTRVPEWIRIRAGFFGTRRVLVPTAGARMVDGGLMVGYSKERVRNSPQINTKKMSQQHNAFLAYYYGLPDPRQRSETALTEGELRCGGPDESSARGERATASEEEVELGSTRLRNSFENKPLARGFEPQHQVPVSRETIQDGIGRHRSRNASPDDDPAEGCRPSRSAGSPS